MPKNPLDHPFFCPTGQEGRKEDINALTHPPALKVSLWGFPQTPAPSTSSGQATGTIPLWTPPSDRDRPFIKLRA